MTVLLPATTHRQPAETRTPLPWTQLRRPPSPWTATDTYSPMILGRIADAFDTAAQTAADALRTIPALRAVTSD